MGAPRLHRAPPQAPLTLTTRELEPEQRLAAAVLERAFIDATSSSVPRGRRAQSAAFLLRDTLGFPFWCTVAGLDCEVVRRRARQRLAGIIM